MLSLIVVVLLVLADIVTKRRDSQVVSRVTCVGIAVLLLFYPVFLYTALAGITNEPWSSNFLPLSAWLIAVAYLSLRLMFSRYTYLEDSNQAFGLGGLGQFLNITAMLGFVISSIGMIVVTISQLGNLLIVFSTFALIALLGLICCLTIILFPIGLLFLFLAFSVLFFELLSSALVLGLGALASGFVLAASVVLGVRAVLAADRAGQIEKRRKVWWLIFACLPIANTVTLSVLRRTLSHKAEIDAGLHGRAL